MTGPLTLSIPAVNPYVASIWRAQGSFVFILPITIYMYTTNKKMNFWEDVKPEKLLRSFVTSFFMLVWIMGLIIGCSMTVTSHAHVLFSSTGLYILFISLVTCKAVHSSELVGYFI